MLWWGEIVKMRLAMDGYILNTAARIVPFDDPVGESLILNQRLEDWQRSVLLSAGCSRVLLIDSVGELPPTGEFILIEDHLFLTPQFLARALKLARTKTGAQRLAMPDSVFLREKGVLGALEPQRDNDGKQLAPLALVFWRGEPFSTQRLGELPLLPVPIRERAHIPENLRLLRDDLRIEYAVTAESALSLRHWSHILDANQLALASHWIDFRPRRILWLFAKLLWAFLTTLSFSKWKLGGKLNRIGRGCEIHPSAWVAGSILGDGVRIGPNSVVFGCVLGDGAVVESQSEVSLSTIGPRAVVSFNTRITASVLYPMSIGSYPAMQMCLLGKRAMHMGGAYPIDMKLTRGDLLDVKVKHQGRVVNSGKKFLGICIGHRAIVGTGLWIQSGVEVPNDYILVRDKDAIVTKIPDGMEGQTLSLNADGKLRPYGEPMPPPLLPMPAPAALADRSQSNRT